MRLLYRLLSIALIISASFSSLAYADDTEETDEQQSQDDAVLTEENVTKIKGIVVSLLNNCQYISSVSSQRAKFKGNTLILDQMWRIGFQVRTSIPIDELESYSFSGDGTEQFEGYCKNSYACVTEETIDRQVGSFPKEKKATATVLFCGDPNANHRLRAGLRFLVMANSKGVL